MNFIKLTLTSRPGEENEHTFLDYTKILKMYSEDGRNVIQFSTRYGDAIEVVETPEEIINMIQAQETFPERKTA